LFLLLILLMVNPITGADLHGCSNHQPLVNKSNTNADFLVCRIIPPKMGDILGGSSDLANG
jgi:hypothetical protein